MEAVVRSTISLWMKAVMVWFAILLHGGCFAPFVVLALPAVLIFVVVMVLFAVHYLESAVSCYLFCREWRLECPVCMCC